MYTIDGIEKNFPTQQTAIAHARNLATNGQTGDSFMVLNQEARIVATLNKLSPNTVCEANEHGVRYISDYYFEIYVNDGDDIIVGFATLCAATYEAEKKVKQFFPDADFISCYASGHNAPKDAPSNFIGLLRADKQFIL